MALQDTLAFTDLDVRLGDGEESETFTAPCALRTRGINFEKGTTEATLMDCATPSAVSYIKRNSVNKSGTISGSGLLDPGDLSTWWAYYDDVSSKNVRMYVDLTLANGGGYWQGAFILSRMEFNGERESEAGLVMITVEMQSDGLITWTDASA